MSIICWGWRETSGCARSSALRECIRLRSCTRAAARRPGSSPSSAIRPARAGPAHVAWWPRQSISTRARIRASWSLRYRLSSGLRAGLIREDRIAARGEMENRIKEQMCLFADRLSTDEMKANQLRLYFSALAYTLMEALRRLGLERHCLGRVRRWIPSAWEAAQGSAPSCGSACDAYCSSSVPPTHGRTFTPTPSMQCAAELLRSPHKSTSLFNANPF